MPRIFSSLSYRKLFTMSLLLPICLMLAMPMVSAATVDNWDEGHLSGMTAEGTFVGFNDNVEHAENTQLLKLENIAVQDTDDPEVKLFIGRATYQVSTMVWTEHTVSTAVSATLNDRSKKWLYLYECTSPTAGDWESSYYRVYWQEYIDLSVNNIAKGFNGDVQLNFSLTAPTENVDLSQLNVTVENVQFLWNVESMYVTDTTYYDVGEYEDILVSQGSSVELDIDETRKDSRPNLGDYAGATLREWVDDHPLGFFEQTPIAKRTLQERVRSCTPVGGSISNGLHINIVPEIYDMRQTYKVKNALIWVDVEKNTWDGADPYFKTDGPHTTTDVRTLYYHINNVAMEVATEVSVMLYSTCRIIQDEANPDDLQCPKVDLGNIYWENAITGESTTINLYSSPWQQAWESWWATNKWYVVLAVIAVVAIAGVYMMYFTPVGHVLQRAKRR